MMRNIHVLHVLNSAHGGSALSTFELIGELKKHDILSSLVCFNNASPDQKEKISAITEGRVLFVPLYWMNKKIRVLWWKRPILEALALLRTWHGYRYQRAISKLIHDNNINVVHTSTILNPEGAIAARRHRLPHVWHVRELIGPGMHFQFPSYNRWISMVKGHANVLVANSRVTESCLQQFFPKGFIRYVPNGINIRSFLPKQHVQRTKYIVGMVGNLTSRLKNHKLFVEVAAACRDFKNIEFRIYGSRPQDSDPYLQEISKQIRESGLEQTCKLVNFIDEPSAIMSEIDILFHPTSMESFGRIFIEAMASAVPVIGIDKGGAQEMIRHGENGYLVKEDDIDSIVSKIQALCDNPVLRQRLGVAGRKLVEEEYTLEILGSRIASLYRNL